MSDTPTPTATQGIKDVMENINNSFKVFGQVGNLDGWRRAEHAWGPIDDPIYLNLFEVEFKVNQDSVWSKPGLCQVLSQMVRRVDMIDHTMTFEDCSTANIYWVLWQLILSTPDATYSDCVEISRPVTLWERFISLFGWERSEPSTMIKTVPHFESITIRIHDRKGDVQTKVTWYNVTLSAVYNGTPENHEEHYRLNENPEEPEFADMVTVEFNFTHGNIRTAQLNDVV